MCCVLNHNPNDWLQQLCWEDIIILFLFHCVTRKASHLKINIWFSYFILRIIFMSIKIFKSASTLLLIIDNKVNEC